MINNNIVISLSFNMYILDTDASDEYIGFILMNNFFLDSSRKKSFKIEGVYWKKIVTKS